MKTEKEMREEKVPSFETMEELTNYINSLVDREHDYGTCVYAMSLAATAAFNYVASKLGVTGFQASCADLDIIRRTRHIESPFAMITADKALYPQHDIKADVEKYMDEWKEWVQKEARSKLKEHNHKNELKKWTDDDGQEHECYAVHPEVWAHWEKLAKAV